jgi:hypothetical protein
VLTKEMELALEKLPRDADEYTRAIARVPQARGA